MAGVSLLALLDDITTLLDDVSLMTKVATKKTAGVLGDDLALNAQQVSGVKPERELPVVWAVAKGSFRNKVILVPGALAISSFIPWAITPLLMIGGLYLCYEGAEKILHRFTQPAANEKATADTSGHPRSAHVAAAADPSIDLVEFEKEKIKGAINTDFILSAEIIAISLGTVSQEPLLTQALVLSTVAIGITVGVYGLVAGIVKLDDGGLYLASRTRKDALGGLSRTSGQAILSIAPKLMRTLSIVGTAAMFLVGGGILLHGLPALEEMFAAGTASAAEIPTFGVLFSTIGPTLANAMTGLVAGGLAVAAVSAVRRFIPRKDVAG
ncbi:DUF808 domain-containing protein [Allohahella marinimesophila]|uniref:DUF808 domain-containing protein n=1 Tax=Allohahella marinimesophila TaxID=1054972 RepID=A0ABP7NLR1_9GAMM